MASPERIYRGSVRVLSLVFVGLGLALLATTFASGGGPVSRGALLGAAFLAVGALRLWAGGFFRGRRGGGGCSDG